MSATVSKLPTPAPRDPVAEAAAILRKAAATDMGALWWALSEAARLAGKIANADVIPYPDGAVALCKRIAESSIRDALNVQALAERESLRRAER